MESNLVYNSFFVFQRSVRRFFCPLSAVSAGFGALCLDNWVGIDCVKGGGWESKLTLTEAGELIM